MSFFGSHMTRTVTFVRGGHVRCWREVRGTKPVSVRALRRVSNTPTEANCAESLNDCGKLAAREKEKKKRTES